MRSLQILTFKLTIFVEKLEQNFEKGEPRASHTDSKRLFVLKAKTLERLGAFTCLKKFAYCGQVPLVPQLSFLHYRFLQVRSTPSSRKQHRVSSNRQLNILFNG